MIGSKMVLVENSSVLSDYKKEMREELLSILNYWITYTTDHLQGGFYGSVSNDNRASETAPKGIVLNSRILWASSSSFLYTKDQQHLDIATRAFQYIVSHFMDEKYGGVFWSVDSNGRMLEGRKQIYGLSFCIYGLTEYYKASNDDKALYIARQLFECIEKYSYDKNHKGYLEALTREWQPISDLRLSEKDNNEKKTANTHLHIIEAYANLYSVWPEIGVPVFNLLEIFSNHFINKDSYHLNLFMDEEWNVKSSLVSYGHDMEAAWLLLHCAETIGDVACTELYKNYAVKITNAALQGLDNDGGLWYEYEPQSDHFIKEKHWWPQAEAMVGFMNAYQLTGDETYLQHSIASWTFIKNSIKDKANGEWFWGIDENGDVMKKDKAGSWKCPYHNTRACLEIINRIEQIFKTQ